MESNSNPDLSRLQAHPLDPEVKPYTPEDEPQPIVRELGPYTPEDEPKPEVDNRFKGVRKVFGGLAAIGLLLLKFGAKLKLLLLLLPKAKFIVTSGTMLVSVAAYTLLWSWKFAIGFVLLLFIHEMGHYIQLRREGIRPSGMFFIPFLGAVVSTRSLGGNALAEARVGLAGPILGSLGCAALIPIAIATHNDLFKALAFTGFFLNLFNLIPVVPFDGGRAVAAMAPWMWFVGIATMIGFMFIFPNPVLIIFILLGATETWRRWKQRKSGEEGNAAYYNVASHHRLAVGAVYVCLIALLAVGMDLTHVPAHIR